MTLNEALEELVDDSPLASPPRHWGPLVAFSVVAPAALIALWAVFGSQPPGAEAFADDDESEAPVPSRSHAVLKVVAVEAAAAEPVAAQAPAPVAAPAHARAVDAPRPQAEAFLPVARAARHDSSAMSRADLLVAAGRWKAAAWWYQQASLKHGTRAEALAGWALCLYELKQPMTARKVAQRSLKLDADQELATVLLGFMAQVSGDVVTARERYQRYVTAHPRGPWVGELERVLSTLEPGPGAPVVSSSVAVR